MTNVEKSTQQQQQEIDDDELDRISKHAAATALARFPRPEYNLRVRILLTLAAILLVGNAVVSVYNSLAVRSEVSCNQQLASALNVISDQNRNNTRTVIDEVLSGRNSKTHKVLTRADLVDIKNAYDAAFDVNNQQRAKLLKTTCQSGDTIPSPSPSTPSR